MLWTVIQINNCNSQGKVVLCRRIPALSCGKYGRLRKSSLYDPWWGNRWRQWKHRVKGWRGFAVQSPGRHQLSPLLDPRTGACNTAGLPIRCRRKHSALPENHTCQTLYPEFNRAARAKFCLQKTWRERNKLNKWHRDETSREVQVSWNKCNELMALNEQRWGRGDSCITEALRDLRDLQLQGTDPGTLLGSWLKPVWVKRHFSDNQDIFIVH